MPKHQIPSRIEDIPPQIDLIELYPLSWWFPLRFTIKYLMMLVTSWVVFEVFAATVLSRFVTEPAAGNLILTGRLLLIVGLIAYLCRFALSMARGRLRQLIIKDGALVVRRGVFLKARGSFALARITDTYIEQDFFDLLFGTATVNVRTPTQTSGDFVKLVGFTKESAYGIQRYIRQLTELLSTQQPVKSNSSKVSG